MQYKAYFGIKKMTLVNFDPNLEPLPVQIETFSGFKKSVKPLLLKFGGFFIFLKRLKKYGRATPYFWPKPPKTPKKVTQVLY